MQKIWQRPGSAPTPTERRDGESAGRPVLGAQLVRFTEALFLAFPGIR